MKIASKQGNGNKIHIYIDGEYTLTVYDDYWYYNGFKDGTEITEEELASLKEEAGFRSAYEKGITYLSMRAYSRKELYDKLKLKYGKESAERAIAKMLYRGYVDYDSFCKEYARYLFDVKKYDIKRINYELKSKGIDSETIDNTIKTLDNEPISRIIEMLRTKYYNKAEKKKDRKKLVNRFVRMGYSFRDIREAFSECEIEFPSV